MPVNDGQPQDVDLERTDRLPILDGTMFDHDVEDDAVRMETTSSTATLSSMNGAARSPAGAPGVDLPSLAESVRSVEERIARQGADYDLLKRSYDEARDAESVAVTGAGALAAENAGLRASLEAERQRLREGAGMLAEKASTIQAVRETVGARDVSIARGLQSLAERDAQFELLQRKHDEVAPELEALSKTTLRLEADLQAAISRGESLAGELQAARAAAAALGSQVKRGEADLNSLRQELGLVKAQAGTYLEQLRSREYRRGFDQNLFRELDAKVGAAQVGHGALEAQRDQLRQQITELQSKFAAQDHAIAALQANASVDLAAKAQHAQQLQQREVARAALADQIAVLEDERERLIAASDAERRRFETQMSDRESAFEEAHAISAAQVKRAEDALAAAESYHAEVSTRMLRLRQEADARDVEMAVLVANLQDARRPVQPGETEVRRLTEELALKIQAVERLNQENLALRTGLESTKAALEEREFLIRRLERSESNNANVLGRLQTSMERLGAAPASLVSPAPAPVECSAELVRLNGPENQAVTHALGRRTRIGRAPGCELQIDYSSVSRHHALVLMGPRDVIIEDLNSTNGVIVNGRKINRQLLNDGDLIVIGEVQFRLALRLAPRVLEAAVGAPGGGSVMG